jgi:hypothetical protein
MASGTVPHWGAQALEDAVPAPGASKVMKVDLWSGLSGSADRTGMVNAENRQIKILQIQVEDFMGLSFDSSVRATKSQIEFRRELRSEDAKRDRLWRASVVGQIGSP